MKKAIVTLMILLVAASMVFAAGTKEEGTKKEVTLSVLWFNDANESDVFLKTIDDYLKANPHVKLDLQIVAYSEYDQKLKLMISGGNPVFVKLVFALLLTLVSQTTFFNGRYVVLTVGKA